MNAEEEKFEALREVREKLDDVINADEISEIDKEHVTEQIRQGVSCRTQL